MLQPDIWTNKKAISQATFRTKPCTDVSAIRCSLPGRSRPAVAYNLFRTPHIRSSCEGSVCPWANQASRIASLVGPLAGTPMRL